MFISILWQASITPIIDFDSLYYHLPNIAKMYQTGTLERASEFGQISFYPYNWELLSSLFIMPFRSDFQVVFPNLIAWLIVGLAIIIASDELGSSRIFSISTAVIVLSMPIIVNEIDTVKVDLAFAAFFLASFCSSLLFNRTRSSVYVGLLLTTTGMTIGIKMSGFGYAILPALILIILEIKMVIKKKHFQIRIRKFSRRDAILLLMGCLLCLILGTYWYIVNWIEIGNPLGYLQVKVFNFILFPGNSDLTAYFETTYPNIKDIIVHLQNLYGDIENFNSYIYKSTLANLFDPSDLNNWNILTNQLKENGGVPFLIIFIQSFWLIAGLLYPIHKSNNVKRSSIVLLLSLLIATWFLYCYTPFSGDNSSHNWKITVWIGQGLRYAFPFFGILGISAACGSSSIKFPRDVQFILTIICATLLFQQTKSIYCISIILILLGIVRLIKLDISKLSHTKLYVNYAWVTFIILIIFIGAISVSFFVQKQRITLQEAEYGKVIEFIQTHSNPGDKIGYVLSFQSVLLYGKNFDREVVSIPSIIGDTQSDWVDKLKKEEVKIVAVGPLNRTKWESIREYKWLEDPNGPFDRIFGNEVLSEVVLYKIKK